MVSSRTICVVTGTRADFGLLAGVMREIESEPQLELQVVATGMHLSPEFGLTCRVIEEEGFSVTAKVEMLLSSDTAVGITKSVGMGVIGFADTFERLDPDLVILLGDRFEILAAAQAALFARIPVAHIAGGDTTEGAFDESIRHSITKMAHLHFVTNADAERRVRQMGEDPRHIFNVGSPGIDQILRLPLMGRGELEESLQFRFRRRNLLVTYHPVTLAEEASAAQLQALLDALDQLGDEVGVLFTLPNADTEGRELMRLTQEYAASRPQAKAFTSLGQLRYLSAMAHVDAVVGNSSSGLYEAPSLKKPTVNIGERQKGRLQASSVINCGTGSGAIVAAINAAFEMDCSAVVNPYGDGHSSRRIVDILKTLPDCRALLRKHFFDLNGAP